MVEKKTKMKHLANQMAVILASLTKKAHLRTVHLSYLTSRLSAMMVLMSINQKPKYAQMAGCLEQN